MTLALGLLSVVASLSSPVAAQAETGRVKPAPARVTLSAPAKVTPTHYQIDVAFEPEKHSLRATAAVTLRVGEKTEAIEFELNRRLTLHSVTDGQGRALEFIRSGRLDSHKLLVRLAEPAPADSTATLTFAYQGALPPGPLDYITKDGILLRDESRWYPAIDLSAFATLRMNITVPSRWTPFAPNGASGSIGHGVAATHWFEALRPVSSRAIAAMHIPMQPPDCDPQPIVHTGYEEIVRGSACFLGKGGSASGKLLSGARASLGFLGQLVGLFDQSSLAILVAFPGQRGANGYSGPGFLVVSEDVVRWHGYPGFVPEFLPHEIAHQWFPIEVTLASQEDGWLAESLAEYLAWRYLEEKQPTDARRMVDRAMRDVLAYQPMRPLRLGLRLFALENWDVTHATLYQRGMLVFRTLETVIGRARVDAALREYYARHRGGPASIADFHKICEEISGRDLGWFFDYYINGAELPSITLRRLPSAAPNELAGEIVVSNAPADFQVRVELRITTSDGVMDHSLATRGEVTPFAIDVRAPVTGVAFDPNLRILRTTEPARRHRAQIAELEKAAIAEEADSAAESLRRLMGVYESAVSLDPENLAANHQFYYLQIGRLQWRLKDYDAAWKTLDRVLALESLDPMATDLHWAWARVYRARIALARGDKATARREAEAGLAMQCPALETQIAWPEAPEKGTTAADELRALVRNL